MENGNNGNNGDAGDDPNITYAEGVTTETLGQMAAQAGGVENVFSQVTPATSLADVAENMGFGDDTRLFGFDTGGKDAGAGDKKA